MKKKSLVVLALVVVLALSFALVACNDKPVEQPLVAPKADTISVDFAKDMTLASVAVPQGYSWKDANAKVKVGTFDYDAEYTDGTRKVDAKLTVNVAPTASMLDEEVSMDYLERYLSSTIFDKDGDSYAKADYDQLVMVLARSNRGIKADIKADYLARVKDVVLPTVEENTNKVASQYQVNTIMTLIALGESLVIDGVDLAAPFYDETIAIVDNIYAMNNNINIIKNIDIPASYKTKDGVEHTSTTTLKKAVDKMMSLQIANGGWSWSTTEENIDIDATTMAIFGLAGIKDIDYSKAVEAVKVLAIGENGGVLSWGSENKNSTATTISALITAGVDPTILKNADTSKNVMDFINSCRISTGLEQGGYSMSDDENANIMLTKDALIALVGFNRYLRGEVSFYEINVK